MADKSKNDSYKTAYYKRIRQCFTDAYYFIDRYKHSRVESDFKSICEDLGKFSDPMTLFTQVRGEKMTQHKRQSIYRFHQTPTKHVRF